MVIPNKAGNQSWKMMAITTKMIARNILMTNIQSIFSINDCMMFIIQNSKKTGTVM